jgi:exopolysaccharide biosynthesis polyprenyl glycosylphosphotransferase
LAVATVDNARDTSGGFVVSIDPMHMTAVSSAVDAVVPLGPRAVVTAGGPDDGRSPHPPTRRDAIHPSLGKGLLMVADLATVVGTLAAIGVAGLDPGTSRAGDRLLLVVLVTAWMVLLASRHLYKQRFVQRPGQELRRITSVAFGAALAVVSTAYLAELSPRRSWLVVAVGSLLAAMVVERTVARALFRRLRARGALTRRVVLAGGTADIAMVLDGRLDLEHDGYEVALVIDLEIEDGPAPERRVLDAVVAEHAGGIVLTGGGMGPDAVRRLARLAHDADVHVELLSPLQDIAAERITVHAIGSASALYLEQVERSGWRRVAKRAFDVVVATTVLAAAAPVFLAAAIAIKVDSRGPVLYRQTRVGRDFVPFEILKFRSMVVDADELRAELEDRNEADGPLFKLAADPRVTRVGAFLRKTSIDELPQLWNVLRGEMSMVGPRPGTPDEVSAWPEELGWRVRVTPGITGMWQVHGRSLASFEDYTRLDLYYVDNWSLATDLVLLAKTVPVVLLRRGAW